MRVLAIDGGGIRGIIPATVLTHLEHISGRSTYELFDVVAGTSTGAILALGLLRAQTDGQPRSAAELRELYLHRGEHIFPLGGMPTASAGETLKERLLGIRTELAGNPHTLDRLRHASGWHNVAKLLAPASGAVPGAGHSRYPAEPLENELIDQLGNTRMSEALRPVTVVSCDLEAGTPVLFKGGGLTDRHTGDQPMRVAARSSSAGPTFFPPVPVIMADGSRRLCVDGGLVANDPSFIAYSDGVTLAADRDEDDDSVVVVSLGTGLPTAGGPPDLGDQIEMIDQRTWAALARPLLEGLRNGAGEVQRGQLRQMLGDRYVRLQTPLLFGAEHAMDNVRPDNTEALLRTGEHLAQQSRRQLQALVERLLAA